MRKKEQYFLGIKSALPTILGFVPIGIAFSIMAGEAGFKSIESILLSAFVFAGAAQMMAIGMLEQGAGIVSIIIATLIFNIRHLIMSTCVFNRMKNEHNGLFLKLLAAFCVVDESFAIFTVTKEERSSIWFLFGLATVMYSSWIAGTALGALASNFLPQIISNSFNIVLYAMYIGLLVPNMKRDHRLFLLVVITALINFALQQITASSWALITATLAGAGLGVFLIDDSRKGTDC